MNRSLTAASLVLLITPAIGVFADDSSDVRELEQPLLLAPPQGAAPTPVPDTVIRQRAAEQPAIQLRVTPSSAETVSPETAISPGAGFPTAQPPSGQPLHAPGTRPPEGAPAYLPERSFPQGPPPGELEPVVLYQNVRIRDPHRAHPLGVPTIIPVPDPRDHCGVVYVEVCMPPCPCLSFWHNRRGTRAEFDFGRYEIDIITRRGVVIIDYDS